MRKERFNSLLFGIGIFAVFLILESAKTIGGFSPFSLGFFVALVYARKNFLVVSPVYVLSSFIVEPKITTLYLTAFPVLVIAVVYFVHFRMRASVSLLTANLSALVSQIPAVVFAIYFGETTFHIIVNLLLTQIFTLCATVCLYAVLVRGLKTRFTLDEMICTVVTASALCLGLFTVEAFGIKLFYGVCAFIVTVMTYSLGSIGLVSGVVFGLGAAFAGTFSALAPIVFGSLAVLGFRTTSPYVSALVYCASSIGLGLYFSAQTAFGLSDCIATAVGSGLFCLLPKRAKSELGAYLTAFREPHGDRHIVNRDRKAISMRLGAAAKVFWELSSIVSDTAYKMSEEERMERMVCDVMREFCGNCPRLDQCERILDGNTRELVAPIVHTAVSRGRATLLELPAYVSGSCVKVNELIPLVNRTKERHARYHKEKRQANGSKLLFAEQLIGIGELLAGLSLDVRRIVGFDVGRERVLIDELTYKNVLCTEAIIEDSGENVTLQVREGEARKRAIEKVVSTVMKKKMRAKVESQGETGFDTVTLSPEPEYDMAFGEAKEIKFGEKKSGDSRLVSRPGVNTFVMAIADGMGSGECAERVSSSAVNLVESFYKAGFSHSTIINLVNKMMSYAEGERYNTLDMCICDVSGGKCDFIKMGACPSFLKRGEKVDVVESSALPMGILQEVNPTIVEKEIKKGDMLILVSDGITDAIGDEYLYSYLSTVSTPNPQELANKIRDLALRKKHGGLGIGNGDDMSVVVGRVF